MATPAILRSHAAQDLGLLFTRSMVGIVFAFHGSQKLFGWFEGPGISGAAGFFEQLGIPLPTVSAVMAGGTEFLGGLALLLGVGARLASVPLVFTMLVAIVTAHPDAFAASKNGMEYPLTLAFVTAGIGLLGPGRIRLPIGSIESGSASSRSQHPPLENLDID